MNGGHGPEGSAAARYIPPRRPGLLARGLEQLATSRINGRLGLACDVATALGLLGAGLNNRPAPVGGIAIFGAGLILFTLIEYAFHRWLFHGAVETFAQGHRRHHAQPLGDDALPFFLPPLAMLGLAGLLRTLLPAGDALLFAAALATGYALYGLSHALIHARRFRNPAARRWAASHHVHHHHLDSNFGVTTPLWDFVFGTRYVPDKRGAME